MNLQAKLSGLKGLVSHSRRRHKGDLTVDMISPPLGDFRHTMHVGRGGDVFGDTSFLSNHGGTANGSNEETDSVSSPDNKIGAFFSRTLRHIRRGSDNRPRDAAKDLSPPPPAISPIIKNAVSLPRLDGDVSNGSSATKVLFPCSTPDEKSSYGLDSGFITLPRLSRSERQQPSVSAPSIHRGSLTDTSDAILSTCSTSITTSEPKRSSSGPYSDSLSSLTSLDTFTFDLGPSLLSEVFGLIDGRQQEDAPRRGGAEAEPEVGSTAVSYMDSLDGGGSGRSLVEWEEPSVMRGFSGKVPDVLLGSAERVGMRMESERFQSATDALGCHYGIGLLKGRNTAASGEHQSQTKKKISYSVTDDEDEIKV